MSALRRLGGGVVLSAFGLLVALAAAEALLQAAAAYRSWTGRDMAAPAAGHGRRILCVGDSNTYGLNLDAKKSYPAQLEQLLGEHTQVVNLGFPGMNTSRLRAELPAMLAALRPDAVLIMIGANDFWTEPVPVDGAAESWSGRLFHRSRVYRLFYMLARWFEGANVEAPADVPRHPEDRMNVGGKRVTARVGDRLIELGWQPDNASQRSERRLLFPEHLAAIVAAVRAAGARPVLLTYPSDLPVYRQKSEELRQLAPVLGVELIDLHAHFKERCASGSCAPLFFGDGHPTAAGYYIVAAEVAAVLQP